MAIHTSSKFYRRGIPNSYNNFAFVAQANNQIVSPMSSYLKGYNFYNRTVTNTNVKRQFPWRG